jgi:hypothetical protein
VANVDSYPAFYLGSNGRKPPAAFEHLDVGSTANELGPGLLAQHKGLDGAIENVLVVGYFVEKGTGNAFRRLKALCINPTTGEVLSGPYRVAGLMPYPLTADRTIASIAQEKLRMLYVPGQSLPPRPARPTAPPVKELEQKEIGLVEMMATYALSEAEAEDSERYPSRPRNPPKRLTFPCVPLATTELSSRVHCHSHLLSFCPHDVLSRSPDSVDKKPRPKKKKAPKPKAPKQRITRVKVPKKASGNPGRGRSSARGLTRSATVTQAPPVATPVAAVVAPAVPVVAPAIPGVLGMPVPATPGSAATPCENPNFIALLGTFERTFKTLSQGIFSNSNYVVRQNILEDADRPGVPPEIVD